MVSKNGLELHHFAYDANGTRFSERRIDGTLIFFVGEYYEYSMQGTEVHEKKYYGREAMRVDVVLYFILTDHASTSAAQALGSTMVSYRADGQETRFQSYKPWGELRPGPALPHFDKDARQSCCIINGCAPNRILQANGLFCGIFDLRAAIGFPISKNTPTGPFGRSWDF